MWFLPVQLLCGVHVRFKSKLKLTELERVYLHNGGGLNWSIPSILHSLGFAASSPHCQVATTSPALLALQYAQAKMCKLYNAQSNTHNTQYAQSKMCKAPLLRQTVQCSKQLYFLKQNASNFQQGTELKTTSRYTFVLHFSPVKEHWSTCVK